MLKRDVAIVLLSCFALLLSVQNESSFSFRKAWFHVISEDQHVAGIDAVVALPNPVVADLNGDGHLEVIVATHDLKLQLVEPTPPGNFGDGFAEARVVTEVSLHSSKVAIGAERWPVAMAAGYLDPEPREKVRPPRKQVLVVVTAGWHVLCFDHNLRLMWEEGVEEHLPPHAHMNEVVLLVTPHQVQRADRGLVVVGGSLALGDLAAAEAGASGTGAATGSALEGVMQEELLFEAAEAAHARSSSQRAKLVNIASDGSNLIGTASGADTSRHFGYFAFEGAQGQARWRSNSSEFHSQLMAHAEAIEPQHNFRDFRESVLAALPHRWVTRGDASLEDALFVRHREGAGAQKGQLAKAAAAQKANTGRASYSAHQAARKEAATSGSVFSWAHVKGTPPGGVSTKTTSHRRRVQPGAAHRAAHLIHNASANALVVHLPGGVEEGALHADVNGDGVIDHVSVTSGGADTGLHHVSVAHHHTLGHCQAIATSGIPPRDGLWVTNVCPEHHGIYQPLTTQGDGAAVHAPKDEVVRLLPPVMLPVPRADGTYSHLRGQGGLLVFMNDKSYVIALRSDGTVLWEFYTGVSWGEDSGTPAASLTPLALHTHAIPTAILAMGAEAGIVLSEHGHELASLWVPFPPLRAPLIADFNGDGLNDIIVLTARGVFGYAQVAHYGGLQFGALLLTLICALGVVYYTQVLSGERAGPSGIASALGVGSSGKGARRLRSTEFTD